MDFPLLLAGRAGAGSGRSGVRRWSGDAPAAGRAPKRASDAAALGRADTIVRDRRHVADRRDVEPDRLQRAQRRFTAGAGALDLDLEGADAMLSGFLAGVFGTDLQIGRAHV